MMRATCKTCGASILFIRTVNGKSMPCDCGIVRFDYEAGGPHRIVTEYGDIATGRICATGLNRGYISHFSTCPGESAHRKKKAATKAKNSLGEQLSFLI